MSIQSKFAAGHATEAIINIAAVCLRRLRVRLRASLNTSAIKLLEREQQLGLLSGM
jgi:hypothetical protein